MKTTIAWLLEPLFRWTTQYLTAIGGIKWGKGSAPPAPDYAAAATAQGQVNQQVANQQTWANRPSQTTPWGSVNWNQTAQVDPATGQNVTAWQQTQTLDPALQEALNNQLGIQSNRSQLASNMMNTVGGATQNPFDWSRLPGLSNTPEEQFTQANPVMAGLDSYNVLNNYHQPTTDPSQLIGTTGQQLGIDMTGVGQVQDPSQAYRQEVAQNLYAQMDPQHQQQQQSLETQLANQGVTPGSHIYQQEMARLSRQQAAERYQAYGQAGSEMSNLVGMQQSLQNQRFGQASQQGQFTNQALMNQYQQQLGQGNYALAAQNQGWQQGLGAQQAFNTGLAQQQGLDQNQMEAYNRAQQQQYGQSQAANQQNFSQMMQAANYQNQLRQQAISEQQQSRLQPLNELNAMLSGQQVSQPNMPGFSNASMAQPAPIYQGVKDQYGASMDAYNSAQAGSQGMMSGLFGLGGMALGGPMGGMAGGALGKLFGG